MSSPTNINEYLQSLPEIHIPKGMLGKDFEEALSSYKAGDELRVVLPSGKVLYLYLTLKNENETQNH